MDEIDHDWMTAHRVHFPRPVDATTESFDAPPGVSCWRFAPSLAVGGNGLPTWVSDVWGGLGLYPSRAAAEAVFAAPERHLSFASDAVEQWHALLLPIAHRGEVKWRDAVEVGSAVRRPSHAHGQESRRLDVRPELIHAREARRELGHMGRRCVALTRRRDDRQDHTRRPLMPISSTRMPTAAALILAAGPLTALAQGPSSDSPERPVSVEIEALNPPVPDDLVLSAERRVPAEQKAAAYNDPDWAPPRTSWGDPSLVGTWSTEDMRAIPFDRAPELGTQEFLDEAQFIERARRQQAGSEHAENVETFHRNAWGTRSFGFSSLVVDPPNGRTPGLTVDGRARAAAIAGQGTFGDGPFDTFEDFSLYDRCIARGLAAGMGAVLYGNGIVINQSPNAVAITYEMIHETRVIALDDRPHLGEAIRQFNGNARGRWDGDTLVVETAGFNDKISLASGAPPSERMRTTERIRRIDPEMIEYRITIDDPGTFTAPFTARIIWTTQPDFTVYEYSCHEGNYAVSGGLAGEREHERRVAEAKAQGLPIPRRSTMIEVYSAPSQDARVFDINRGE